MLKELRHNPRALALAVLVHVALIAALVVSLDWTRKPAPAAAVETVQATVVDEAKVRAEQEKLKEEERRKQEEEQQRLKKLEQEVERARQAREQEQQRLTELETQRKAEAERLAKLRQEQQRAAEQKRQAEQQRLAEEKAKKDEQKRLADIEAKRKIEEEKKRQEEQARREQQLKKQIEAEQQAAADKAREAQARSLLAQYTSLIEQKVRRNWLRPASAREGMSCTVRVRLIPGGEVSDVRVVKGSGDELFDRSVVTAVYKASPLPLPPDAALFDYFRELEFIFKP